MAMIMQDTPKKTDEVQVQFLRKTLDSKIISFVYPTHTDIAVIAWGDLHPKSNWTDMLQKVASWQDVNYTIKYGYSQKKCWLGHLHPMLQ